VRRLVKARGYSPIVWRSIKSDWGTGGRVSRSKAAIFGDFGRTVENADEGEVRVKRTVAKSLKKSREGGVGGGGEPPGGAHSNWILRRGMRIQKCRGKGKNSKDPRRRHCSKTGPAWMPKNLQVTGRATEKHVKQGGWGRRELGKEAFRGDPRHSPNTKSENRF